MYKSYFTTPSHSQDQFPERHAVAYTVRINSISGTRTRQTCGFFTPDLWRDKRRKCNRRKPNTARLLIELIESRRPLLRAASIKRLGARHGQ